MSHATSRDGNNDDDNDVDTSTLNNNNGGIIINTDIRYCRFATGVVDVPRPFVRMLLAISANDLRQLSRQNAIKRQRLIEHAQRWVAGDKETHPSLLRVSEVVQERDTKQLISMDIEHCDRGSLAKIMGQILDERRAPCASNVVLQLLAALAFHHSGSNRRQHGAVTLDNIFVQRYPDGGRSVKLGVPATQSELAAIIRNNSNNNNSNDVPNDDLRCLARVAACIVANHSDFATCHTNANVIAILHCDAAACSLVDTLDAPLLWFFQNVGKPDITAAEALTVFHVHNVEKFHVNDSVAASLRDPRTRAERSRHLRQLLVNYSKRGLKQALAAWAAFGDDVGVKFTEKKEHERFNVPL